MIASLVKYLHGHVAHDYFLEASVHNDADTECSNPMQTTYWEILGLGEIMWEDKHRI